MPTVIRNFNSPNEAVTLGGVHVRREKEIYLPSYKAIVPVLQTSMHFCFRDASNPRGATLFCTCGSPAVTVGYEAYKGLASYMGNEVLVCHSYIMSQLLERRPVHADGSHE